MADPHKKSAVLPPHTFLKYSKLPYRCRQPENTARRLPGQPESRITVFQAAFARSPAAQAASERNALFGYNRPLFRQPENIFPALFANQTTSELPMSQSNPVLNTAYKAARRAGDMMLRAAGNLSAVKVDSKAFNDFVSEVDRESEHIITAMLQEAYPHHKITAEESGTTGRSNAEYEWIIAPLDGTANYLHGHPQYAVSMALLHKGVLQEALVYAPARNELYTASRGHGAQLDGRRIRVSTRTDLAHSLIGTGFPVVDQSVTGRYLAILKDFIAKTAGARREGAAALDLSSVAAGRFDGFFEFGLKPWDIAAGALIVQEAGGIVTDMQGDESWLATGNIVAANPKILAQMLKTIAAHPERQAESPL